MVCGVCVCVFHSLPPPLVFIGGSQESCIAELQLLLLKLMFSTNEEAPCQSLRRWGQYQLPTAFSFRLGVDMWSPWSLSRGVVSDKSV